MIINCWENWSIEIKRSAAAIFPSEWLLESVCGPDNPSHKGLKAVQQELAYNGKQTHTTGTCSRFSVIQNIVIMVSFISKNLLYFIILPDLLVFSIFDISPFLDKRTLSAFLLAYFLIIECVIVFK